MADQEDTNPEENDEGLKAVQAGLAGHLARVIHLAAGPQEQIAVITRHVSKLEGVKDGR